MSTLLHMTLTGSVIILFVLVMRLLLRRAPKIYSYLLWSVVLFRLLCPAGFSAPVSLLSVLDTPTVPVQNTFSWEKVAPQGTDEGAFALPAAPIPTVPSPALSEGASGMPRPTVLSAVWLLGMAALFTYSVISLLLLRRRLLGAMPLEGNVYLADHIDTPFVLGLVRPRIYLPSSLSEGERGYILLHERHHIRRGDHLWKLLGFLALCIHWFNPLVWLAFVLAGKDMEMSCDEAVLKTMGSGIRADYSASLLSLSTGKRIIAGAPLAFGEGDTKSRIQNALRWRTPPTWVRIAAALACGIAIAVCAADPAEDPLAAPEPFGHTYYVGEVLYDDPHSANPFEAWVQGTFTLSADHALTVREGNTYLNVGSFRETEFPALLPAEIRKGNKTAWVCTASDAPATALYYLLLQKDGSVLLAQGHTAGLNSDTGDIIEFLFRLERADYAAAKLYVSGGSTDLGPLPWYPQNFDFDYDSLHTATVYGSATLVFAVENAEETLTVEEHYYSRRLDDAFIDKELHTLTADENGKFSLSVSRRNDADEHAIYYVAYGEGRYVLRIDFPFAADTSGVTTEEVEAIFRTEKPDAAILDSVVSHDGAYGTLGVVLYTEDSFSQHLAYVMEEGWCYPVGLGSEEVPLTSVPDPQLTYLGKGTVTWLCEQNGAPLRYNMDFSRADGHVSFRPTSAAVKTPLDIAIDEALRTTFFHNNTMNACGCVSHVVLSTALICYDAAMDSFPAGGINTVVQLLALGMDFQMENGALIPIRERALSMELSFQEAADGSFILMDSRQDETTLGNYDAALRQECYAQAAAYFGIETGK